LKNNNSTGGLPDIRAAQQRARIVELIKCLANLRNLQVNRTIKAATVLVYARTLELLGSPHKGLYSILEVFGSPADTILEVQL